MAKNSSVIQINGNRYDAFSGQQLNPRAPVIDGLRRVRRSVPALRSSATKVVAVNPKNATLKRQGTRPAQKVHQRTQHSKTLMRSVVTRPSQPKRILHDIGISKTRTSQSSGGRRFAEAMNTFRSSSIKRFGPPAAPRSAKALDLRKQATKAASPVVRAQVEPKREPTKALTASPSLITSVSHHRLERMLDEALIKADAHKQASKGRFSKAKGKFSKAGRIKKWSSIAVLAVITSSVALFFAYRNVPQFSTVFASMKSDVKTSIPAYVPSGYKFAGPAKTIGEGVSITYKGGYAGDSYTLTQEKSSLDSTSLKDNVIPKNSEVQSSQVKGTTIYIYNSNTSAAWVNNGVKYVIKGSAKLSPDQLLKIADSL